MGVAGVTYHLHGESCAVIMRGNQYENWSNVIIMTITFHGRTTSQGSISSQRIKAYNCDNFRITMKYAILQLHVWHFVQAAGWFASTIRGMRSKLWMC